MHQKVGEEDRSCTVSAHLASNKSYPFLGQEAFSERSRQVGGVLIFLPCWPFSLQSFLLLFSQNKGGGGRGPRDSPLDPLLANVDKDVEDPYDQSDQILLILYWVSLTAFFKVNFAHFHPI